jgi:hypothetical protein
MRKYEIYLPLKYNDGTEIEAEKIKQIREELIAVFRRAHREFSICPLSRNLEVWRGRFYRRHYQDRNHHQWRSENRKILQGL